MGSCGSREKQLPNPHKIDLTHFVEYKIIGRGGFGTVNAVARRDAQTGQEVPAPLYAMKRLKKEGLVKDQTHVDMVWYERDIMRANTEVIKSRFLCSLQCAFQTDEEVFLVMEFMQGGDLRYLMRFSDDQISKQKPTPEDSVLFYMSEILLALKDQHSYGIIYRDLKPENVLLDSDGHIRLADFGISCRLSTETNKVKGRCGTLTYMSPEMLSRQEYGAEADVWAFGVTMFELQHAEHPFAPYHGAHTEEAVRAHFMTPLDFSSKTSPVVKDLLTRLLNPVLQHRLTDWDDIKAHPFFSDQDWTEVAQMDLVPPVKPAQGVANCSNAAALDAMIGDLKQHTKKVDPQLQELFREIEYVGPDFIMQIR